MPAESSEACSEDSLELVRCQTVIFGLVEAIPIRQAPRPNHKTTACTATAVRRRGEPRSRLHLPPAHPRAHVTPARHPRKIALSARISPARAPVICYTRDLL